MSWLFSKQFNSKLITDNISVSSEDLVNVVLIYGLLFLPISTVESAVAKRLVTH